MSLSRNIIKEEYSISKDVIRKANEIIGLIKVQFEQEQWLEPNILSNNLPYKRFVLKGCTCDNVFKELIGVEVIVIDVKTKDNLNICYDLFEGGYDMRRKIIILPLPFYDGGIDFNNAFKFLTHELEHAFQSTKAKLHIESGLYGEVIRRMNYFTEDTEVGQVLSCIYFLFKPEVDAFTQSLWSELDKFKPETREDCFNMPTYLRLRKIRSYIKTYLSKDKEKTMTFTAGLLRIKQTWLERFLVRQLGYAERKFRRVLNAYFSGYRIDEVNRKGHIFYDPPYKGMFYIK